MHWSGLLQAALVVVTLLGVTGIILRCIEIATGRKPEAPPPTPTEGPLVCPYCGEKLQALVSYMGQQVSCPQCCSAFHAPGGNAARIIQGEVLVLVASIIVVIWAVCF